NRFCLAAASAAARPVTESGPMNAIGLASTLTLPVRTYFWMSVGIAWVSKTWHAGHCRSMYSARVTGAFGEPRTFPCWGIPFSVVLPSAAFGSGLTREPRAGVEPDDEDDDLRPVRTNPSTIASTIITTTNAAPISTFGEAWRRWPGAFTGGGGTCVWRLRFV